MTASCGLLEISCTASCREQKVIPYDRMLYRRFPERRKDAAIKETFSRPLSKNFTFFTCIVLYSASRAGTHYSSSRAEHCIFFGIIVKSRVCEAFAKELKYCELGNSFFTHAAAVFPVYVAFVHKVLPEIAKAA